MTTLAYVAVAVAILGLTLWLAWHSRVQQRAPAPYPPEAQRKFRLDDATSFASHRLRRCSGLDGADLRLLVDRCAAYVASQSRPMNGGGPRDGWLVPPNVFDVVSHLRREADAAHLDVDEECLWEVVNLHDEYLRTLRG